MQEYICQRHWRQAPLTDHPPLLPLPLPLFLSPLVLTFEQTPPSSPAKRLSPALPNHEMFVAENLVIKECGFLTEEGGDYYPKSDEIPKPWAKSPVHHSQRPHQSLFCPTPILQFLPRHQPYTSISSSSPPTLLRVFLSTTYATSSPPSHHYLRNVHKNTQHLARNFIVLQ